MPQVRRSFLLAAATHVKEPEKMVDGLGRRGAQRRNMGRAQGAGAQRSARAPGRDAGERLVAAAASGGSR